MDIPNTIYMQHDCDGDLSTWCVDRINENDLVYVREQQLALERMECVCRAWPAGTTPLPRLEALVQARAEERARCVAIVERYTAYIGDYVPAVVLRAAREMLAAIGEG